MRDLRSVFYILGILISIESIAMLVPMFVDLFYKNEDWIIFLFSSIFTFVIGLAFVFSFRKQKNNIRIREAFILTILSWIIIAFFASIPFIYSASNLHFTNALFESISGITTTGATVITNLDHLPEGILIWRSLLQWFGGIGIIVLALAILPTLQIGGMQLLHMEHDDPYEKTIPKINQFVLEIILLYIFLTFFCSIFYFLSGMNGFESIAHSMTTISTGGFSTNDDSFKSFYNFNIELTAIAFMIVGSLPFVIFLKTIHGDWKSLFSDDQIKLFFLLILILTSLMAYWLINEYNYSIIDSIKLSTFNIISILTGTGYTSSNFNMWGGFGLIIMFIIMFIGGCAGSTTGGVKIFRLQLLFRGAQTQIKKLIQPHGVFVATFNQKSVSEDTFNSIMGFFFMYILIFFLGSIVLSFFGLDFLTAISASASAISNVGPGLGNLIGPNGNYNSLPLESKWVLSLLMLIGRLELLTFLVLLSIPFWKK